MYGCDIIHITSTYLLGDIYLSSTHELKGVTYMNLGDYIFVHLFFSPDQNYYLQFLEETAGNQQVLSGCDDCSTDPISLTQPFAFGYIQHYNAYVRNLTSDNYYPHYRLYIHTGP